MTVSTKPFAGADDIELGKRLQQIRKTLGLTQTDLAGKLDLSYQQVQKYEKGINRMSAVRLNQIIQHLGVPWTYFFDETESSILSFFQASDEQKSIRDLWEDIPQHDIRLSLYILSLSIYNAYYREEHS